MKILLCHNYYQQTGGEDQVFVDECRLLESRGHDVVRFTVHNDAIVAMGQLELARKTFWNDEIATEIGDLMRRNRFDVLHCHNIFPLISPAVYYVARREGVSVVQTLHNYRAICPKAQLLRNGAICEKCIGKEVAWPAVVHRGPRDSSR